MRQIPGAGGDYRHSLFLCVPVLSGGNRGVRKYLGKERISLIGTGTIGVLLSNVTQLGLAGLFVFGQSMIYIIPPFLAAGTITGFSLGLFCELFTRRSVWYTQRLKEIRNAVDRGGPC